MATIAALLSSLLIFWASSLGNALSLNHYDKTCPDVEATVANVVKQAVMADKKISAALLRMHFHDCFLRVYTK